MGAAQAAPLFYEVCASASVADRILAATDQRLSRTGAGLAMTESTQGGAFPPLSPFATGPICRCPRCGKGHLFTGFLTLRPRCEVCGLDYSFVDAGDGPAVFIMLFAGFIVVAAALIVEVTYQPPFWVHAVLWAPLILLTTIGPLRPMKGLLIALQYHHKAAEGQLAGRDPQ
jgi:uncharacterized protein (DUF983 family)